eukprot:m.46841 g.46841  ORF g.46841 m.46841 type:complete len:307 (-) comp17568_c0_seq1:55-975(-)
MLRHISVLPPPLAAQIEQASAAFLARVNPDLDPATSVTRDWAFCRLEDVVVLVAGYLAWVLFGLVVRMFSGKEKKTTETKTVAQKFASEPILVLQALYNPAQVCLCAYMMYETMQQVFARDFTLICNEFNPNESGVANILWVFYMSKVFDFLDTVFIVLRGKWSQFSFLHVYHHMSIFAIYWMNTRAAYDGDIYYTIVVNSFIHLVMYFYYFLRTFNVYVPTPIKAMVTNLQMIQFVTMMSQASYLLWAGCPYPRLVTWIYLVYIFSLLLLFQNFASRTYGKGDKKGDRKKQTHGKGSKKDHKKKQ